MSKITFFRKVSKILLLSVVTISLCSTLFIQPVNAIYATDINVADLHLLANQEREKAGLAPLTLNAELSEAAQNKASHMIANNYWDHYAPDGTTPWSFIKASGYDYKTAGENLAEGFSYSSDVVAGWMNSPTHKANVLGDYADVGYASLIGVILGEETTLVVAMYGEPKSDASIASTTGSSVTVSTFVEKTYKNSVDVVSASNTDNKSGLVKGIMASLPVSAYISASKDTKLIFMAIGVLILSIAIRFLLFKIHSRRGYDYIWFRKRPIFGSMILLVSFFTAAISSLGFVLL